MAHFSYHVEYTSEEEPGQLAISLDAVRPGWTIATYWPGAKPFEFLRELAVDAE